RRKKSDEGVKSNQDEESRNPSRSRPETHVIPKELLRKICLIMGKVSDCPIEGTERERSGRARPRSEGQGRGWNCVQLPISASPTLELRLSVSPLQSHIML